MNATPRCTTPGCALEGHEMDWLDLEGARVSLPDKTKGGTQVNLYICLHCQDVKGAFV